MATVHQILMATVHRIKCALYLRIVLRYPMRTTYDNITLKHKSEQFKYIFIPINLNTGYIIIILYIQKLI